ncbi:MAG TPA: hypothetical protein VFO91_15560 [Anaerolineales bacterium]|nr:hypothetical protein [Anaerolineales bacterium]
MKKSPLLIIASTLVFAIGLAACGTGRIPEVIPTATTTSSEVLATVTLTLTPDLCAPENIKAEVDKVHKHMREFDDASTLAASMPREQLSGPIANLQLIRRDAEDEVVPSCLSTLKDYQIQHMNSVIGTLIAFMSINDPLAVDCVDVVENTQEAAICQNIAAARQQHDQYTLELARILEIPIVTATPGSPASATSTPTP